MASKPPNLLWDLDLDLDVGFQDQGFNRSFFPLQDDLSLSKDPLKHFDPSALAQLDPSFGSSSLQSAFTRPLSPLFKDLPLFPDDERAGSGDQANRSGSGNSTDEPGQKTSKPKRTRKPQKDRLAEVEERVHSLQKELQEGQQKQEELLLQQARLEGSATSSQPEDTQELLCDNGAHKDLRGHPNPNQKFWLLDVEGNMQHMKGTEIVNLSADDSLAIHQIYMDRLGQMLARRDGSADKEITELAEQVCKATYLKGIYKPESMREIINYNKLGLGDSAKKQVWSRVLMALQLSTEQRDKLLHFRRLFLPTQRQLLQTRQQLIVTLKDTQNGACRTDQDLMKQTAACRRIMRQLQQNLHADQSILNRLFAQVFGEVLQGVQKAIILVEFWPCPFDLVGLLNQLADEAGDTATQELLGIPPEDLQG
ncbi:hypothetical protein WJX74_003102 [Apatococcus lobatus]|uniref:Uncharacterized protein n=1 Tax=Apatococcus lobatus TaxID=904363 RepID=A0AAW1RGQ5_9CHLO